MGEHGTVTVVRHGRNYSGDGRGSVLYAVPVDRLGLRDFMILYAFPAPSNSSLTTMTLDTVIYICTIYLLYTS